MRDENIAIAVEDLPDHLQAILRNIDYKNPTISAIDMVRQYSMYELGDYAWADSFIRVYNDVLDVAMQSK